MSTGLPDPIHWQPRRWDEAIGSEDLIAHFKEMVHGVRLRGLLRGFNTLVTGKPRTGKTCLTRFAIRCLYCQELDIASLNPCAGTCQTCRENPEAYGLMGFQNHSSVLDQAGGKTPIMFHYIPVDCSADLTTKQLENDVLGVTRVINRRALVVVYFDEVHHLAKKGLDAMLLKPLEDHQVIWLGTSAYLTRGDIPDRSKTLDQMFMDRFPNKFRTKLPSIPSLAKFLHSRCVEFDIAVESPPKELLFELARRATQTPYYAMQLLSRAWKKQPRLLTWEMVTGHNFEFE